MDIELYQLIQQTAESVPPDKTRKADGIRRRWCKPSRPTRAGAHG